jgi:hypothetical protein
MIRVNLDLEKLQSLFCIDDVENFAYAENNSAVEFESDSNELKYILDMNGIQYEIV